MKQFFRDPDKLRLSRRVLWTACAVTILAGIAAPFLFPEPYEHLHYSWEGWFFSYAVVGFVSFVGLVLLARLLRPILWRSVDFYDDRQPVAGEGEETE